MKLKETKGEPWATLTIRGQGKEEEPTKGTVRSSSEVGGQLGKGSFLIQVKTVLPGRREWSTPGYGRGGIEHRP